MRTALYRHFASDGQLLYIGISLDAVNRLNQHRDAEWSSKIASVTIEWFPSRDLALLAEVSAIKSEAPTFNKIHNIAARRARLQEKIKQRSASKKEAVHRPRRLEFDDLVNLVDAEIAQSTSSVSKSDIRNRVAASGVKCSGSDISDAFMKLLSEKRVQPIGKCNRYVSSHRSAVIKWARRRNAKSDTGAHVAISETEG